jgi:hypothetical protein
MTGPSPELLSGDALFSALILVGLRTDGDLVAQADRLVEFFGTGPNLVQCDKCHGWSDPSVGDGCPFCGEGDDAPPVPTAIAGAPKKIPTPQEEPTMKTDVAIAPEDKPLRALERKMPAVLPETVAASSAAQNKALDAAVQDVKKLQRDFHANAWDVGRALTRIYEADLWKARVDESGAVRYKNFEAFTREELDIGRKYAQDLLRIASRFTREDVLARGTTALRLVIQAPEEHQAELLGKLQAGAPRSEIEAEVRQVSSGPVKVTQPGGGTIERKRPTKKPARPAPVPKLAEGQITIAVVEGKKQLSKLYAKPTGKNDANNLRAATCLEDVPWGYLDLSNDVRMFFTIVQAPSGELSIRHDFRRPK